MATQVSILAWRIPCVEEPGGYSPWGGKEPDTTEQLKNNELLKTYVIPNVFEVVYKIKLGLPGGAGSKEPACQCRLDVRDMGSDPG